jgi:site-specific DNA-cytosine methylase
MERNTLKVLVACEYSGVVRNAFRARGFNAWSCDLLPSEDNSAYHIQGDVFRSDMWKSPSDGYPLQWDLMIAHPPCTHLAVSGARWFKDKQEEQKEALEFVKMLMDVPVKHIAIENPISIISSKIRKPDQIIQPWMFGHGETKATCLWLKNLPKLTPTDIVEGREARIHKMAPSPDRWKERSRTYTGIAEAMAKQWGDHVRGY